MLEYFYRTGRIDQMLGMTGQALLNLKQCVEKGAEDPSTFATRAAFQIAVIYENSKDYRNALDWYEKCLEYFDNNFTPGSVEDQAEKGKMRVEELVN